MSSPDIYMHSGSNSPESDQGWVSWAWSFVPAIVGEEEEGEEDMYLQREGGGITRSPQQHTPKDPIVSIGFYCTKASVTFKVFRAHKMLCATLLYAMYVDFFVFYLLVDRKSIREQLLQSSESKVPRGFMFGK